MSADAAMAARVIRPLPAQSHAADHIWPVIPQEPCLLDEGIHPEALPAGLRQLRTEGRLGLVHVPSTGPCRKLPPALRRHAGQERLNVTVDDDTTCPPRWLTGLIET